VCSALDLRFLLSAVFRLLSSVDIYGRHTLTLPPGMRRGKSYHVFALSPDLSVLHATRAS
jgi:hypothetical protein